jgi:hypothetical protein
MCSIKEIGGFIGSRKLLRPRTGNEHKNTPDMLAVS